jgi:glycosyltransferase involved in cell wall biosynthesis
LGLQDEVVLVGNLPYTELPMLYRRAVINLFASSCENCPNILLEALAAGRPVLCSDYQPMPEFGADAVMYFDPYQPQQLADRLKLVLSNPELQEDLGRRALDRSHAFYWEISALTTWVALGELARANCVSDNLDKG